MEYDYEYQYPNEPPPPPSSTISSMMMVDASGGEGGDIETIRSNPPVAAAVVAVGNEEVVDPLPLSAGTTDGEILFSVADWLHSKFTGSGGQQQQQLQQQQQQRRIQDRYSNEYSISSIAIPPSPPTPEEDQITATMNADSKDVDKILANALTGLSLEEREKAYEEVHGCDRVITETPQLISDSLMKMDAALSSIYHKPAFDQARSINRQYVDDINLRLQFLRAEYFNAKKAAIRIVKFFKEKLTLFGLGALARPVYLSDLSHDDMATLQSGYIQLLPTRDRAGRPIFMDLQGNHFHAYKSVDNITRCFAYMMMAAAEDVESQRRGLACIAFYLKSTGVVDPMQGYKCGKILSWGPIRFSSVHFCTNHPFARTSLSLFMDTTPDRWARFKLHDGTQTEIEYSLMTFGLPVDTFPVTSSGEIKRKEQLQWIARRNAKDRIVQQQQSAGGVDNFTAIDLPGINDVLLGRGKKFQEHAGNVRLRSLVYEYAKDHIRAKPSEKARIVEKILQHIHEASGRFLQRDNAGWWNVASHEEAIAKVSHTIRTARSTETIERMAHRFKVDGDKRKKMCMFAG